MSYKKSKDERTVSEILLEALGRAIGYIIASAILSFISFLTHTPPPNSDMVVAITAGSNYYDRTWYGYQEDGGKLLDCTSKDTPEECNVISRNVPEVVGVATCDDQENLIVAYLLEPNLVTFGDQTGKIADDAPRVNIPKDTRVVDIAVGDKCERIFSLCTGPDGVTDCIGNTENGNLALRGILEDQRFQGLTMTDNGGELHAFCYGDKYEPTVECKKSGQVSSH